MIAIKQLQLNRFKYVSVPTRRQVFNKLSQQNRLHQIEYSNSEPGEDPFSDPVNVLGSLNKIEMHDTARYLANQKIAEEKSTAVKR